MLAAIANQAAKNPGLEQSELLPSVILLAAAITSGRPARNRTPSTLAISCPERRCAARLLDVQKTDSQSGKHAAR